MHRHKTEHIQAPGSDADLGADVGADLAVEGQGQEPLDLAKSFADRRALIKRLMDQILAAYTPTSRNGRGGRQRKLTYQDQNRIVQLVRLLQQDDHFVAKAIGDMHEGVDSAGHLLLGNGNGGRHGQAWGTGPAPGEDMWVAPDGTGWFNSDRLLTICESIIGAIGKELGPDFAAMSRGIIGLAIQGREAEEAAESGFPMGTLWNERHGRSILDAQRAELLRRQVELQAQLDELDLDLKLPREGQPLGSNHLAQADEHQPDGEGAVSGVPGGAMQPVERQPSEEVFVDWGDDDFRNDPDR